MGKKLLSDEQEDYLKTIYLGVGNAYCADMINKKFSTNYSAEQIKRVKQRLKLNSGLTGQFEKGHKSEKQIQKGQRISIATEFKKGHKPNNWVPIGTEALKSDGYIYVKVADIAGAKMQVNWKQKHRIIWEETYGEIPKGHHLIFLDGNHENVTLENLACLTKSQILIMNRKKLIYKNPELTKHAIKVAEMLDLAYKKSK